MRLFILGHGRHGKDTVAEYLKEQNGLSFQSSSMFVAERAVVPYLKLQGIEYPTLEECYADRVNHREAWYQAILEYNKPDRARLARALFDEYDMYVGLRDRDEFLCSRHMANLSVWVDASERVPEIDPTCKVLRTDCDIIIDNNGTKEALFSRVYMLAEAISGE